MSPNNKVLVPLLSSKPSYDAIVDFLQGELDQVRDKTKVLAEASLLDIEHRERALVYLGRRKQLEDLLKTLVEFVENRRIV
jgi:hypothetical protein